MYDIKFTHKSGKRLASSSFQPNRTSRGREQQPLYERLNTGFYSAEPAATLVEGDTCQIHELEPLEYDDEPMMILTDDPILYDGEQVYHDGEFLYDITNEVTEVVTWMSRPKGSGEFTFASGAASSLIDDVETLKALDGRVNMVIDETTDGDGGGQVLTSTGLITEDGGDC